MARLTILSPLLSLLLILAASKVVKSRGLALREATVEDLQLAFKQNRLTSRQLVEFYLREIQRLNPVLKGVIEVNPDALYLADKADQERKAKAAVTHSKLHGIPILVKDNIATKDKLNTTAGSYALLGSIVPRDAGVVKKLRQAGAIILGKASLSEWSQFRSDNAPSGWSARGGQGLNPYNPLATPCGSSSGSAISVAANLAAVSLGTETDGSILCPANLNSVVGIKPTVGLTSRAGVVPISPRQDSVGQEGAILVDHLKIDNVGEIFSSTAENTALSAEFKVSLNAYLKELVTSPVRSLADVIAFNNKSKKENVKQYGQNLFLTAEATNGIGYAEKAALSSIARLSKNGFEKVMKKDKLDALVAGGGRSTPFAILSTPLALGGFPGIIVPAGYKDGVPFGICFGGLRGSEPKLIEIAYAFEQATKIRKPPKF
ncbi:probable amidase At4g34880 isoform X2 [Ziziphus jujuba]|uniref:Probable amidase At4g34880 isoform X2 n=1 Tax=Ziziphus jujuba TaxID=326968 RepID=A0ABM4AHG6_ZIZJJ|nr:probable amidase At4g34880 isoform X2 [Ziziphus jujuba]